MNHVLIVYYVISMISEFSIFIALIISLSFVENVLKKIIQMKDVLLSIFMKLKRCAKCIDWINRWIKSNLKKEKTELIKVALIKKFRLIKWSGIQNGFLKGELNKFKKCKNFKISIKCKIRNKLCFSHKVILVWIILGFHLIPKLC